MTVGSALSGKVAVVTGGAVRLGRAISLALAEAGCDVFIHYGRSEEPARKTKADAEAKGVRAAIHCADLVDVEATQEVIPAAVEALGRVDILINSAAIFLEGGLAETSLQAWESQFAINLRAPFLLSQAFAAQVPADGQGQIINITDARVYRPAPDHFAYRLTKSALVTMTETLALDLAPRIRVNAVALGAILPPPGKDEAYLEKLAHDQVPLRRPGNATVVTRNVLHLLREAFVTGVVVKLDGGQFL
jgi:glucose 1-dehydrogenase